MQALSLSNFRIFLAPQKEIPHTLVVTPYLAATLSPWQPLNYFLSVRICLFWTLHLNIIRHYVAFCIWLFHIAKCIQCWNMYHYFIPFYYQPIFDLWMCHILLICLSVDGHLATFQFDFFNKCPWIKSCSQWPSSESGQIKINSVTGCFQRTSRQVK